MSLWTHRTRRHILRTTIISTSLWHSVFINYCSDMFRPRFLAIFREHIGVLMCPVSWYMRRRWRRYNTNLRGVTHYRTTTLQTAAAKATPPHIHTVWATAECWYISLPLGLKCETQDCRSVYRSLTSGYRRRRVQACRRGGVSRCAVRKTDHAASTAERPTNRTVRVTGLAAHGQCLCRGNRREQRSSSTHS
jgi:hypothetical protein